MSGKTPYRTLALDHVIWVSMTPYVADMRGRYKDDNSSVRLDYLLTTEARASPTPRGGGGGYILVGVCSGGFRGGGRTRRTPPLKFAKKKLEKKVKKKKKKKVLLKYVL